MKQRILFATLVLLLLAACHKENPDPRMEIFIEKMQGDGKLTLDGVTSTWNDGDTIRLNGTPVVVERHDGHAYISNTASQSTNRAFFPTRLNPTTNEDAVTVTLPREYDYRSDGTHQQLTLPLAARATGDAPLHFQHLTGALCFMLTNSTSHPLTIDKIVVNSNKYQLSGNRTINLGSIGTIGPNDGAGDDLTVAMTFTKQSLVIPASGNANVVLPIAPVGSDNIFTASVIAHYQGDRYVYTKTQGAGKPDRSLDRNEIGYAAMELATTSHVALFEGSGTKVDPFLITSVTDFLLMAEAITNNWSCPYPSGNYKNYCYKLTNSLNLSGYTIHPIENYDNGTFDGNGKTISGLTIISEGGYCALFKTLTHGLVKGLTLQNTTLKHTGNVTDLYMGGIGALINTQSISNCTVSGTTYNITGTITYAHVGGIVGRAEGSDTLSSCSVTATSPLTITASTLYYGNMFGRCHRNSLPNYTLRLSNCTANNNPSFSINTTGELHFGGMIGNTYGEQNTLINCDYVGTNTLTYSGSYYAGGLIGRYTKGSDGSLSIDGDCSYSGTINGVAINKAYGNQ